MKIQNLIEDLNLSILVGKNTDTMVEGVYVSDMLSWVMSHAKKGDVWVTLQCNINIVAIASLVEIPCIIIVEGVKLDDFALNKAEEKGIVVLSSDLTGFEICCKLGELFKYTAKGHN